MPELVHPSPRYVPRLLNYAQLWEDAWLEVQGRALGLDVAELKWLIRSLQDDLAPEWLIHMVLCRWVGVKDE